LAPPRIAISLRVVSSFKLRVVIGCPSIVVRYGVVVVLQLFGLVLQVRGLGDHICFERELSVKRATK